MENEFEVEKHKQMVGDLAGEIHRLNTKIRGLEAWQRGREIRVIYLEEQLKSKHSNQIARDIVAMLFWEWRRLDRVMETGRSVGVINIHTEGMRDQAEKAFRAARGVMMAIVPREV